MGGLRDFSSLAPGAMVAPQVVVVERLQLFVNHNHARASGVDGNGSYGAAIDAARGQCGAGCHAQRTQMVRVRLRGKIRIFLLPLERILRSSRTKPARLVVKD